MRRCILPLTFSLKGGGFMLTADLLYADLMRGCLDGKAFTFVRELGQCRTQTVETEDGTAETPLDSFQPIQDAVSEVKKMLERCPELKATYPQKTVSESFHECRISVHIS